MSLKARGYDGDVGSQLGSVGVRRIRIGRRLHQHIVRVGVILGLESEGARRRRLLLRCGVAVLVLLFLFALVTIALGPLIMECSEVAFVSVALVAVSTLTVALARV